MATIKHSKTNNITDWTQAELNTVIAGGAAPLPPGGTVLNDVVLPSDWNDDHTITNIVNADISASAAIDASKIADGTVSSTEFQYINSLTSNAQTQIDSKQATLSGASFTAVTVATDDKILIQDTSDSNNLKTVTAQSIADLSPSLGDGDKGDITVSSSGTVWTIDAGVVTLAKQADMATASVVYRKTAGAGAPEVNTLATLKTDLGLTGTNSGDQTSIAGITGTKSQFDTAVTDGNFLYVGDVTQYTDEMAQDAVGAMVDTTLVYVDATPLLTRGAITGDISIPQASNTSTLATVNSNVGSFGSATQTGTFTVNGKGLTTAASNITITPAVGSITGLGTGVATFLATPSSANLLAAVTDETGTGALVFGTSPTIATASLGSSTATTQAPADNSTKLATTAYVDNAILGQNFKEACKYASTAALPSIIYANGSSGVGATLTGVAFGALSMDSNSPAVNDRVLIKNQVSTFQNGIYTVTATGSGIAVFVLTRTTDADQAIEYKTGDSLFITSGSTLSTTTWAYTGADSPVMGTDALTFAQVAGQGSFTGGNGITITGTSIAIDTSVTVDKNTVQTLTNKTLTSPTLTTPVLGTPSSGDLANCTFPTLNQNTTGSAATLTTPRTIGGVSFDGSANIVPQTIQSINEATDTTCFPLFISASGTQSLQPLNNTALTFNSNTGTLGATTFSGAGTSLTGTAASLTVGNVTTNANLTGDVTSSGNATTIANDAVTYAKIQNVSATDKLLGRSTAGAGDVEEIACTAAGRALLDDADASAQRTTLGLGTLATQSATITDYLLSSTAASTYQPLDSDLTTIAGLTATSDNFLQAKSSAWASRTPTQVTADLIAMVGDSGSGGTKGLVPAPAIGDATKYLKGDGTWSAPAASLTVGSSAIASGTTTRILYDNAGTLGEYTITGTGTVVAMAASPVFTAPTLGVATGTSLALTGYAAFGTTLVTTQGTTTVLASATDKGQVIKNAASQTGNNYEAQNSSGTAYFSVGPDTLAGDSTTKNFLNLTATMPTTMTATTSAVKVALTGAGSSAQVMRGFDVSIAAGYTGGSGTFASIFTNASAGTGAAYAAASSGANYRTTNANYGGDFQCTGTTAGINVGARSYSLGSSVANYATWATATASGNTPALNVGTASFALNATINCAGFFALADYGTSAPTFSNAALICDNGGTTGDIAVFRDNGTAKVTIADGGRTTFANGMYISGGAAEMAVYDNGNSGTSKALNLDNGNFQKLTLTGAVAITQTTPTNPGKYTIVITQDATGRVYSLSSIKWAGGVAPTYSTAANKVDIFSIIYDGTNYYGTAGIAFA